MKKFLEDALFSLISGAFTLALVGVGVGCAIWSIQWVLRLLGVM